MISGKAIQLFTVCKLRAPSPSLHSSNVSHQPFAKRSGANRLHAIVGRSRCAADWEERFEAMKGTELNQQARWFKQYFDYAADSANSDASP
jgi:hypothetical protein